MYHIFMNNNLLAIVSGVEAAYEAYASARRIAELNNGGVVLLTYRDETVAWYDASTEEEY